jgi:fatty acid desaturase
LLFFFFFTFATFAIQANLVKKEMGKVTRASMMITIGRLLLCLLLTALLIYTDKENAIAVVFVVGVLYLVFTIFEVTELSAYVRNVGDRKSETPDH